jgi:hypothetical protein
MQLEGRKYLYDIQQAARRLAQFTESRTFDRALRARLSENVSRTVRVECHVECHWPRKIRNRTQTVADAGKNRKALNRCSCERSGEQPMFIGVL